MQAVILAAGKSTRTYPLTLTRPKPLLKVANKTLLEHNLNNLKNIVEEVIIIVGYKKEKIKKFLKSRSIANNYKDIKIRLVEQKNQLGTAHALSLVEPYIKDRFILLMGDDIYVKEDIERCIKHKCSMLIASVKNPQNFGVIIEKDGILIDIIEKPKKFISNLVNTALYSFDRDIFQFIRQIKESKRKEFELPDVIKMFSKYKKIHCIKTKKWFSICYPWDLLMVNKMMIGNKNNIGNNSKIYGDVKNSSIGNNCLIYGNVCDSIIMEHTTIDKDSIVESSVIGENVHFKGEIISKKNVYSTIKGKKIKAGRLGAIIADNVVAKNVIVKPGFKIWPNKKLIYKKSTKSIEGDVE